MNSRAAVASLDGPVHIKFMEWCEEEKNNKLVRNTRIYQCLIVITKILPVPKIQVTFVVCFQYFGAIKFLSNKVISPNPENLIFEFRAPFHKGL